MLTLVTLFLAAPDVFAASPAAARAQAVEIAGSTVKVSWGADATGRLELRPYRTDRKGKLWTGAVLAAADVHGRGAALVLPAEAPLADRAGDGEPELHYVFALRTDDGDGEAGTWIGAAGIELVWRARDGLAGGRAGWNLYDTRSGDWYALDHGVSVDANLLGEETLVLSGAADEPTGAGSRLVVNAGYDAGAAVDVAVGATWSLTLPSPPSVGVVDDGAGLAGGWFTVSTYEDADGDASDAGDAVTGTLCHAGNKTELSWFEMPLDLGSALEMRNLGVRSGWDIREVTAEGDSVSLSARERASLHVLGACR